VARSGSHSVPSALGCEMLFGTNPSILYERPPIPLLVCDARFQVQWRDGRAAALFLEDVYDGLSSKATMLEFCRLACKRHGTPRGILVLHRIAPSHGWSTLWLVCRKLLGTLTTASGLKRFCGHSRPMRLPLAASFALHLRLPSSL
jgi:hypothetical protein